MKSPLYWSGSLYSAGIAMMHGRDLQSRYRYISKLSGASVLDVGCGTGKLVSHLPKGCHYLGIDLNDRFLHHAKKRGRNVLKQDALSFDRYSEFEVCVIMDVLHHITPHHRDFLKRVLNETQKRVIVCEPVAVPGRHPVMNSLIKMMDDDGINSQEEEWMDKKTLIDFYASFKPSRVDELGQAMIAVYEK